MGGVGPSKNRVTWGIQNFLLEWGDKLEKAGRGGGGGSLFLLLDNSITFTVCEGKVRLPLLLFGFSVFRVSHARFSSNSSLY